MSGFRIDPLLFFQGGEFERARASLENYQRSYTGRAFDRWIARTDPLPELPRPTSSPRARCPSSSRSGRSCGRAVLATPRPAGHGPHQDEQTPRREEAGTHSGLGRQGRRGRDWEPRRKRLAAVAKAMRFSGRRRTSPRGKHCQRNNRPSSRATARGRHRDLDAGLGRRGSTGSSGTGRSKASTGGQPARVRDSIEVMNIVK